MKVNKTAKKIPFFKMSGLGNDFIFLDKKYAFETRNAVKIMCDRKIGIGCDQMIIYQEDMENKIIYIDIINNDGTFAESCGNAFRCAGDYFCEKNSWDKMTIISTKKEYQVIYENGTSYINMGTPLLKEITLDDLDIKNYHQLFYVNVGNPHVVLLTQDPIKMDDVIKYGKIIENHKMFPKKTNVNFVRMLDENNIEIQTWERGIGYSISCGTGATASFVASNHIKLVENMAIVHTGGGSINIAKENNHIIINGETLFIFDGVYNLAELN